MDRVEEALETLKRLGRKHGPVLSLKLISRELIQERICDSKKAVADCLRKLETRNKIRPFNFGVNVELLEKMPVEYVQSSLASLKKR